MEERDLVELLKALRQGNSGANIEKLQKLEKDTIDALHWHVEKHLNEQVSVDSEISNP